MFLKDSAHLWKVMWELGIKGVDINMRIEEVKITKFRSIKKASFVMDNITAIVGENNAGKTAILRALNSFFNFEEEKQNFIDRTHQYAKRSNSYIEIYFADIPVSFFQGTQHSYMERIGVEFYYSYSENRRRLKLIKDGVKETISNADLFMERLSKYIQFVYISSERTNIDISWGHETLFSKLIINYANKHTENRDTLSTAVRKASTRIRSQFLSKLERNICQLYLQNKDVDLKIDFPDNLDYRSLLEYAQISLNESGSSYLLEEWGSGTKSLIIIAMHRANALIEEKSIVLGIEEPEQNLHPQAQKRFLKSLGEKMDRNEVQAIFTTHSTVMVDEIEHENILLVRRVPDEKRSFISTVKQIPKEFWEKYDIAEEAHYNYFSVKNSDFFFSKYVIICESPIDTYVFKGLISPLVPLQISDVSFIDLDGVKNLIYPFFLLQELEIPFSIIVDRDYLFDYKNNDAKSSVGNDGFPEYKEELTQDSTKRKVIDAILKTSEEREGLEQKRGYRNQFSYLEKYNLYCLMFCLEKDLLRSSAARDKFYDLLRITEENKNAKYLLSNCSSSIKKRTNILSVVEALEPSDFPESFKKIKNSLIEEIKKYC